METHPVEVSLAEQCVPVPVDCTGLGIAGDRIMAQITGDVRATDELCRMSEHNEKKRQTGFAYHEWPSPFLHNSES